VAAVTSGVAWGVGGLLVLVVVVVMVAALRGDGDWRAPEYRAVELRELAAARGWRTGETAAPLGTLWPGAPFGIGVARRLGNVLHAQAGALPVTVFDYGYELPGYLGVVVRAIAVYVVWLPAPVAAPVWSHRGRHWSVRVEHDAVVAWCAGPLRAADVTERLVRLARICAALHAAGQPSALGSQQDGPAHLAC
jgi:hypothetical protein